MIQYDMLIPVAFKDYSFLKRTVKYIEKNLNPDRIFIVTKGATCNYVPRCVRDDYRCEIIDEDKLLGGLTFQHVENVLLQHATCKPSVGWYYQQLLKYAFALSELSTHKYYVSWDADTLPLRQIDFFNGQGKPFFTMKDEHNKPYFDTIRQLLGIVEFNSRSYIAEQMVFDKDIVKELLKDIEQRSSHCWYDAILYSTNPVERTAFSEFETYGNYCNNRYPKLYEERMLPSFRLGGYIAGRFISDKKLHYIAFDQATISFELTHFPPLPMGILHYLYAKYKKIEQKVVMKSIRNTPPGTGTV